MTELGHVVYYVRNLEASLGFYRDAVGLALVGKLFNGRAALLSGGRTHHELLLIEVGEAGGHRRENGSVCITSAGKSVTAWTR